MTDDRPDLPLEDVIRLAGSSHRYFAAGRAALALYDNDHNHPMVHAFWDVAFAKCAEAEDQFFGAVGAPVGATPAECARFAEGVARRYEFGASVLAALVSRPPRSDATWTPFTGPTWRAYFNPDGSVASVDAVSDDDDEPEIRWSPGEVAP